MKTWVIRFSDPRGLENKMVEEAFGPFTNHEEAQEECSSLNAAFLRVFGGGYDPMFNPPYKVISLGLTGKQLNKRSV